MPRNKPIQELVSEARQGDRNAFDQLAEAYRHDLLRFVNARIGPTLRAQLDPEDVVQDALLKAFQALDRFQWRGEDSVRRWLCGIAEHLIRNASRKRLASLQRLSLDMGASGTSPSRALRREERFQRLHEAVRSLTPDHCKVIELARIEGLKIEEIAHEMQRTPGAVKQLLSRALDQLKSQFGDTASLGLPDRPLGTGDEKDE